MKAEKALFIAPEQFSNHVRKLFIDALREAGNLNSFLQNAGSREFGRKIIQSFNQEYTLPVPEDFKPVVETQEKVAGSAVCSGLLSMVNASKGNFDSGKKAEKAYHSLEKEFKKYAKSKNGKSTAHEEKILKILDIDAIVSSIAITFTPNEINSINIANNLSAEQGELNRQNDRYAEAVLIARGENDTRKTNPEFQTLVEQCEAVRAIAPILTTMPAKIDTLLEGCSGISGNKVPSLQQLAQERHLEAKLWLDSVVATVAFSKDEESKKTLLERQKNNDTALKAVSEAFRSGLRTTPVIPSVDGTVPSLSLGAAATYPHPEDDTPEEPVKLRGDEWEQRKLKASEELLARFRKAAHSSGKEKDKGEKEEATTESPTQEGDVDGYSSGKKWTTKVGSRKENPEGEKEWGKSVKDDDKSPPSQGNSLWF